MAELNLLFLLNKIVSAKLRITAQSFHPSVSGVIKKPHAICKNANDNLTHICAPPHKPAFRL